MRGETAATLVPPQRTVSVDIGCRDGAKRLLKVEIKQPSISRPGHAIYGYSHLFVGDLRLRNRPAHATPPGVWSLPGTGRSPVSCAICATTAFA